MKITLALLLSSISLISSYVLLINQTDNIINLAEIALFHNGIQIDNSQLVYKISSTFQIIEASRCFDDAEKSFCSTSEEDSHPWILVDSGSLIFDQVVVLNRISMNADRILNASIRVFDHEGGTRLWGSTFPDVRFKYIFDFVAIELSQCPGPSVEDCWRPTLKHNVFHLHSQSCQDDWAINFFQEMRNGVFVEVGANDGITYSNAYTLEHQLGWRGLVIEPLQKHYKSLVEKRLSPVLNFCVYNRTFISRFLEVHQTEEWVDHFGFGQDMLSGVDSSWKWNNEEGEFSHHVTESVVPCFHMQEVLDSFNISHIDYLTLDAEGAELLIAQAIDWTRTTVTVVNIDFGRVRPLIDDIFRFFASIGYVNYVQIDGDVSFFK